MNMLSQRILRNGLLLAAACCNWSYAAHLTVCASDGADAAYKSINAAVAAAAAGDEIDVCPALYAEQIVIAKPLTLHGAGVNGIERVLVQPSTLTNLGDPPFQAVISVVNAKDVFIDGLAIDASQNAVSGCTPALAGVHFFNSSGGVSNNAVFGAQLSTPTSCTPVFPGNDFGVQVDTSTGQTGPFSVSITGNSIHDFNRDGILVNGSGITAQIAGNAISGVGPANGYFQFGVFIANGAVAHVVRNTISQANCLSIDPTSCVNLRSEGIVFRAVGDGSVADSNVVTKAQSGIFLNGANKAQITNNLIMNIDALDGIYIPGTASGFFTNSLISRNTISHVSPISTVASVNEIGCGIYEVSGTGVEHNGITDNTVTTRTAEWRTSRPITLSPAFISIHCTQHSTLTSDPEAFPPAVEP